MRDGKANAPPELNALGHVGGNTGKKKFWAGQFGGHEAVV